MESSGLDFVRVVRLHCLQLVGWGVCLGKPQSRALKLDSETCGNVREKSTNHYRNWNITDPSDETLNGVVHWGY